MSESWGKAIQSFQTMDIGSAGASMPSMGKKLPEIHFAPEKLQELQQQYMQEALALFNSGMTPPDTKSDKRFADAAWGDNPVAAYAAAVYLLNARTMMGLAEAVDADPKTRNRIRFAIEQWMAAAAPSNFMAFNAEAQKKAIETKGESIAKGMKNLMHDLQQGHVSMTDESLFEVGKNVATTEGAVVFENELFQLIEYKPLT
ncbi:MAG TPA: class I poly(R)-hydroxyalkanoic acid synthase, partial [Rhodoferax sp.]|nr:class I poly(R)-hydroxyalkanoic acid synthase [Rhodoferax sp.]